MALHTYTPTEWKNAPDHKTTPINATNLNNIETGIDNAYTDISAVNTEVGKKAAKADITSISETEATASQAIAIGTVFYLNGVLVRAKTAIASGATFTENTNYETVTIAEDLVNEPVLTGSGMRYLVRNGVLILTGSKSMTGGTSTWVDLGTLPAGYRPKTNVYGISTATSGAFGSIYVQTNGKVQMRHVSSTTYTYYFSIAVDI